MTKSRVIELFISFGVHGPFMDREEGPLTWNELLKWALASGLITVIIFTLYSISSEYFGESAISALTAFSAGVSSVISILLVAIYMKQTRIFERHGKIMEAQTDLMELEYIPDVAILDELNITENQVEVTLENKGSGAAVSILLVTRIEFQSSEFYDSPLTGTSELLRAGGEHSGEESLVSGNTGTFTGEARLDISTLSEDRRSRGFENVIKNLRSDVDRIRVSLFVRATGPSGDSQEIPILPEDAFYTNLEDLSDVSLQECRRVSVPA